LKNEKHATKNTTVAAEFRQNDVSIAD